MARLSSRGVRLHKKGLELLQPEPRVVKIAKDYFHIHTYGGFTPFFAGLLKKKLMATRCANRACKEKRLFLPPRPHCPDCLLPMKWVAAPLEGTIYTHTTILYPGAPFKLTTPCPLISVELPGVCTRMMSYLKRGTPYIGMKVRAVFNTAKPTHSILDLAFEPVEPA